MAGGVRGSVESRELAIGIGRSTVVLKAERDSKHRRLEPKVLAHSLSLHLISVFVIARAPRN